MPRFGRSSGVRSSGVQEFKEFEEFREFGPAESGARYERTFT
jgi:hypothetical protein